MENFKTLKLHAT